MPRPTRSCVAKAQSEKTEASTSTSPTKKAIVPTKPKTKVKMIVPTKPKTEAKAKAKPPAAKKKTAAGTKRSAADAGASPAKKAAKRTASTASATAMERSPLPRVDVPATHTGASLRILSWNVNGLRALVKSNSGKVAAFVQEEQPDVLCLQETKIQEKHVKDFGDFLPGFKSYWSCSTKKLGYAGTAVFIKESLINGSTHDTDTKAKLAKPTTAENSSPSAESDKPSMMDMMMKKMVKTKQKVETSAGNSGGGEVKVTFGIGDSAHDGEGRAITVELPHLYVVNLYVPNAGQKLERLAYRTTEWDPALRAYIKSLEDTGKPVIVTGDLNCAHHDMDIHNPTAKHIPKTSGCTKQERASFTTMLEKGSMVDSFRALYPKAQGAFTYWSVRAGNRPWNRGLRLDYFVCSSAMFPHTTAGKAIADTDATDDADDDNACAGVVRVVDAEEKPVLWDSFIVESQVPGVSDHCPVGAVVLLPGQ